MTSVRLLLTDEAWAELAAVLVVHNGLLRLSMPGRFGNVGVNQHIGIYKIRLSGRRRHTCPRGAGKDRLARRPHE